MPVRLILYDLDGTLVDTREDLANAVNRTLADLGLPTPPNP
jgi:phosphoglycolate phosphatase